MANFIIEDNVPIPERGWSQEGKYNEIRTTMHSLKVGQSFVIYGSKEYRAVGNAGRREGYQFGTKFSVRKDSEPGFYRVWRIK